METPWIRPGRVDPPEPAAKVVALFPNAAPANAVVQLLIALGIPSSRIGVTSPDRMPRGQGMLLAIGCPDPALVARVEEICRKQGAEVHRQ